MENSDTGKDERPWYEPDRVNDIPSPALLVFPSRIEENIRRMVSMAGSAERLRPHVKTHKMSAVVRLKQKYNISKFKCSTLSEVEMVARCGGKDIMLAMQPCGPNIGKVLQLQMEFPGSRISVIADHEEIIRQLSARAVSQGQFIELWLDINNGMNRTGVKSAGAPALYRLIHELPNVIPRGLHVYDGHIHNPEISERIRITESDFKPVHGLISLLKMEGLPVPAIVAGGTPTFPVHAFNPDLELSPGTLILWDAGYGERYADLDFLHAAVILTRVISLPDENTLCLDLGHKAIAAEMPHPRVRLMGLPEHNFVMHSEEHLVLKLSEPGRFKPGDLIYGIPWHVCPAIPRYAFAYAVEGHTIVAKWKIDARDRELGIVANHN